ncbi:MAG: polysaccharide biosynthesis C-terminal domain-containing protein [Acidobacteria bacterium]|nr:polysaccharide biosynthesis C-terminal domain-containing protein [Acidobacteriota bacterium]
MQEGLSIPLTPDTAASADLGDFLEESRVTRGRLLRGGALFGISQFLGMALGFGSGIVLVRVADKPAVASYMLLQQAILSVGLVMQLGLGPAALRFVPVCRGRGGAASTSLLRRRLFAIQIILWAVIVPLLALAWPLIARRLDAPELAKATGFLVAAAVLSSFGNLVDSYLRSFRLYTLSAPLTHLVPRGFILAGFLVLLLAAPGQQPWEMLACIYVGAMLMNALLYGLALRATTSGESSEPRAAHAPPPIREILGTSTAMGLRSAASVLFVSSSLWVLSWARPHEEVAVYGVAATLLQLMAAIPSIANFVVPQEFAVLHADGRNAEMERLARTAATLVAILSAACLAGLLLLGRPLVRLAYGSSYVGAWGILLVLAVGSFWDCASGGAGYVLQMAGHHVRLLLLTLGGAVLNVVLSLALAPLWGGYGIAAATTVTLIALNVAMVKSAKSLVGVRTFVYTKPSEWLRAVHLVRESGRAWKPR